MTPARALALIGVWGCVDTELSLVVELESASVAVRGEAAGDVLEVELTAHVRVGEHAVAGDDFELPRASLYVAGAVVADLSLARPEGFSGRLEPGEETDVAIVGSSSAGAFPDGRAALCGNDVEVVVDWRAAEQADDPLDPPLMKVGTATLITSDVRCD